MAKGSRDDYVYLHDVIKIAMLVSTVCVFCCSSFSILDISHLMDRTNFADFFLLIQSVLICQDRRNTNVLVIFCLFWGTNSLYCSNAVGMNISRNISGREL